VSWEVRQEKIFVLYLYSSELRLDRMLWFPSLISLNTALTWWFSRTALSLYMSAMSDLWQNHKYKNDGYNFLQTMCNMDKSSLIDYLDIVFDEIYVLFIIFQVWDTCPEGHFWLFGLIHYMRFIASMLCLLLK